MNKLVEDFIKESGITRFDKHHLLVPESSLICLEEGDDLTPAELLKAIVNSGKDRKRIEIFNALTLPESVIETIRNNKS